MLEETEKIFPLSFPTVYGLVRGPCSLTPDEASAATVGEAPSVATSVEATVGTGVSITSIVTGAGVGEGVGSPQIVSSKLLLPDLAPPLLDLPDLALPPALSMPLLDALPQ